VARVPLVEHVVVGAGATARPSVQTLLTVGLAAIVCAFAFSADGG
jgi:hypothetical protein